ncbi:MAG TPA: rRNA adenine N-6-methyltransferase family protein [Rhizomicrobium sp.]|jgi:protein-L-isoaspartate(D-aspartate) O-methyltransferase
MTEDELQVVRRAYAKQILAAVALDDARIEAAFAAVKREDYVGPGPWKILRFRTVYQTLPSADPVYLYTDELIGLVPERRINNGQPSLHAHLLGRAQIQPGEHVVHIGTGTGYYTAIMAHLAGASGHVTGIEFDEGLAARATANLAPLGQVEVIHGDGALASFAPADVIYVNAGATRPADIWLDRLKDGGRLILPLTTDQSFGLSVDKSPLEVMRHGAVFRITRKGDDFLANWISPVAIFPCEGARDETSERALAEAFAKDSPAKVTRLVRRDDVPEERCWLRAQGWSLCWD